MCPSEHLAVLDTELRHSGVNPSRVKVVTVGFNGAQALVAGEGGRVRASRSDDGVALQVSGHPITAFALDSNGGPAYPGPGGVYHAQADCERSTARARFPARPPSTATRTPWRSPARA